MKFQRILTILFTCLLIAGGAVAQDKGKGNASNSKGKGKGKGRAVLEIPKVADKDIICFALYTVSDKILKLTAQLYPIPEGASKTVRLEVERDGK